MKPFRNKFLATAVLSLMASPALIACGGGSSVTPTASTASTAATGTPATGTTPATDTPAAGSTPVASVSADPISVASGAVATAAGATLIASASSDEEVYNLAADIGDTWQLILNNKTNTYVMRVLNSQYGLTSTTSAGFTKTTVGSITTISGTTGSALSVQLDTRTKTLAGNATVGSKKATVSGSGYNVTDTKLLAGNYGFMGSVRNVANGQFRDNPVGSFIVAANGVDITVCDKGIVVNNACAAVPNSGAQVISSKPLKVSRDSATGVLMLKDGTRDFGVLHVSAGDRGPVLIIDRFGLNDDNVLRAGVIFAAKPAKLAGTEFNGTFNCSVNGIDSAIAVVTGNTYTVKDAQRNTNNTGTLQYNKVVSGNGLSAIDLDGAAIAKNVNETLAQASLVLPLSSSLAVLSRGDGTLDICRRAS